MVLVFLWSPFAQVVYGNPIVVEPTEDPIVRVTVLIIMFFIGVAVEYAFFNSRLVRKITNEHIPGRTLLEINLVTFPLTQIFAYVFYLYFVQFFWLYVLIIEIGVILVESYLIRLRLKRVVDEELSSKLILGLASLANLFSFLIGLIAFLPEFRVI